MKGKFIILFIIIILALSSTSVAALMYWQGQNLPVLNKVITAPFVESSPRVVFDKMYNQMKILSTARYDLQSDIQLEVYDEIFNINLSSVFEGDLKGKPIGRMTTDIWLEIQSLNFISKIESRFTEDKIYYSVTEVPAIPFVDLEKIHTKWYEYFWSDSDKYDDSLLLGMDYVSINNLISNIERLPDEYIDNKLSYHYLVSVNFENIAVEPIELWIGKQSFLPYKGIIKYRDGGLLINSTLLISKFNESVAIDRPENGIKTDKFVEDLFGETNLLDLPVFGYLVGLDDKYLIDDPDDDKLYSIWEDLFGTDKNNNDTDDDGFIDGEEIRNGYNPNGSGKLIN